jgi:signal transduction histidine kinase
VASDRFSRFVSLACHDLRTPLATVSGFAHTLDGMDEIGDPAARYIGIMRSAGEQMGELLDALGLVARIEGGRYEPALVEADSLELAEAAAAKLGERASATGSGGRVRVDLDPIESGLAALALCAVRHGGLEHIALTANDSTVEIAPIPAAAAPIVLGEDLKDLGAAAARSVTEAIGGSVALEGERLVVRLPA